jgi:hypothetical protein
MSLRDLILIILLVCGVTVVAAVSYVMYLFNKWANEQMAKGPVGYIYLCFGILIVTGIVAGLLIAIGNVLLYMGAGALLGTIFAIPQYLGAPWWVAIVIGTLLGVIVLAWKALPQQPANE